MIKAFTIALCLIVANGATLSSGSRKLNVVTFERDANGNGGGNGCNLHNADGSITGCLNPADNRPAGTVTSDTVFDASGGGNVTVEGGSISSKALPIAIGGCGLLAVLGVIFVVVRRQSQQKAAATSEAEVVDGQPVPAVAAQV